MRRFAGLLLAEHSGKYSGLRSGLRRGLHSHTLRSPQPAITCDCSMKKQWLPRLHADTLQPRSALMNGRRRQMAKRASMMQLCSCTACPSCRHEPHRPTLQSKRRRAPGTGRMRSGNAGGMLLWYALVPSVAFRILPKSQNTSQPKCPGTSHSRYPSTRSNDKLQEEPNACRRPLNRPDDGARHALLLSNFKLQHAQQS